MAGDEADIRVALGDEVLGHAIGRLLLICVNERRAVVVFERRDANVLQVPLVEHVEQVFHVAKRRCQQQAVDPAAACEGADLVHEVGVTVLAGIDQEAVIVFPAGAKRAGLQADDVGRAGVVVEQGDQERTRGGQPPGRRVWLVVQLGDDGFDFLARLRADAAFLVDDTRHRLQRNAGHLCDHLHGYVGHFGGPLYPLTALA